VAEQHRSLTAFNVASNQRMVVKGKFALPREVLLLTERPYPQSNAVVCSNAGPFEGCFKPRPNLGGVPRTPPINGGSNTPSGSFFLFPAGRNHAETLEPPQNIYFQLAAIRS
jgi:hypothetical protein